MSRQSKSLKEVQEKKEIINEDEYYHYISKRVVCIPIRVLLELTETLLSCRSKFNCDTLGKVTCHHAAELVDAICKRCETRPDDARWIGVDTNEYLPHAAPHATCKYSKQASNI